MSSDKKRLLVCVEAVDTNDPSVSFFLVWIRELARHFESIEVVALKTGTYEVPPNVQVHSLGKERARGTTLSKRVRYIARLWRYAGSLRAKYDAVLVFQAEEHILAAGWLWKLLGKPQYFWRNHYKGSVFTNSAVLFCRKVFYTSKYSYTARFAKSRQMPLGIDITSFTPSDKNRDSNAVLFLARIAPSKRVDVLLSAVEKIPESRVFHVSIVGDPLPRDAEYYAALKERAARNPHASQIAFLPGVPNTEAPRVYQAHGIAVNCSQSGMYDKTIFEAAASGCIVLASSKDFADIADPRCAFVEGDANSLAEKLQGIFDLGERDRAALREKLRAAAEKNSLAAFGTRLVQEITL